MPTHLHTLTLLTVGYKKGGETQNPPPQPGTGTTPHHTQKKINAGSDLLSHTLPSAVPSAQAGLASGFGMGPGVTPPLTPPTKTRLTTTHHKGWVVSCQTLNNGREHPTLVFSIPLLVLNVRPISTGHLHTLLRFQIRPINPIISRGPQMKPYLGTGFPLRCFQRLSLPYVANQPCPRRDNWHTRGTSNPVLSY